MTVVDFVEVFYLRKREINPKETKKTLFRLLVIIKNQFIQDICAFNDPLGQIHSPSSSDHYSHLKTVL